MGSEFCTSDERSHSWQLVVAHVPMIKWGKLEQHRFGNQEGLTPIKFFATARRCSRQHDCTAVRVGAEHSSMWQ